MNSSESLRKILSETPDMLSQVHRWSHYSSVPRGDRENVLEHTFRAVMLTAAMLAIEEEQGNLLRKLDGERLLLTALIHDIGEGSIGDVLFAVRQDSRIKDALNEIENEKVNELIKSLPLPVRDRFLNAYQVLGEDSTEGRFFNAVERIGYAYYAIEQYRDHGRKDFIQVLQRQHPMILDLEQEFVSLKVLYDEYREYVDGELKKTRAPHAE